jgi:hypothetical protein
MTYHISTNTGPIALNPGARLPSVGANRCHIIAGIGRSDVVEL